MGDPDGGGEGIVELDQYCIERLSTSVGLPRTKSGFGGYAMPEVRLD